MQSTMSRDARALVLMLLITCSDARVPRAPYPDRTNQLIASLGIRAEKYNPRQLPSNMLPQLTDVDRDYRRLFLDTRRTTLNWALDNLEMINRRARREGKMQKIVPRQVPFPCPLNNTRSRTVPTSVERLRPGDIDIIAAMGDSISAGNGLMSTNALHMLNEFRGLVFSGGGLGNWRTLLTLPNILKVFNPKLYGYATGNALVVNHQISHLSIAEPMVMSHDLLYQARVLIDLLQRDPHVDMQQHWKLVTIFVGSNDLCTDMCHWDDPQKFLDQHARDLREVFRLLRDNVPRLLINLIAVPNILLTLKHMQRVPLPCYMVQRIACHCLVSDRMTPAERRQRQETLLRWQQIDLAVARSPEFQREDFAIVAHPVVTNMTTPLLADGQVDWRIFSHDCFHFSQRTHAMVSNQLWNSMLLPDELKPRPNQLPEPFEKFLCTSEEHPYLVVRPS